MLRLPAVLALSVALSACGGSSDGSDQPDPAPPPEPMSGAWEGQLVYQRSQTNKSAKLAIMDGEAWIKIEGDKAAGFEVEKDGDEVILSGKLKSGWPKIGTMMGNAVKHPAYKDLLANSLDIEIKFTLQGRDAVGSFKISGPETVTEYGVFSLLPIMLEDGPWYIKDIREAEITCGQSGGYPLLCYSDIDLSADSEGKISGQYRDFHKYNERPPTMYSTIPSDFRITGQVTSLKTPGFFSVEMEAPRLGTKGFGYRKPSGELEYCISNGAWGFNPTICP